MLGVGTKVQHKETDTTVDIRPEGMRPGVPSRLAPTLIRHPGQMGGVPARLKYIDLPALVELKLAAGRSKDEVDVVELIRAHSQAIDGIRSHLAGIHTDYSTRIEALIKLAAEDESR